MASVQVYLWTAEANVAMSGGEVRMMYMRPASPNPWSLTITVVLTS
jgi:hypothetical protein